MGAAAKVGLLVLVFVGLLMGAYAILGRSLFAEKMDTYFVELADAGGAAKGAPVLLAGVKVGAVEDVRLVNPKLARLTLQVRRDIPIPQGTVATLPTALIGLGESQILLEPPTKTTVALLPPGSTLPGRRAGPLEDILPNSKETMAELGKTLAAMRKLLEDGDLKHSIESLLKTTESTLAQYGGLADQVQNLVADNRGAIQSAIRSTSIALSEVRRVTAAAAKLAEDPMWRDKAVAILNQVQGIAARADDLMQGLNAFVHDPELRSAIKSTASNAQEMSKSGVQIAETGTRIAANTEQITANGVTISEKAIELADKANALADEAREALKKVSGFFDRVPSRGGIKPIEVGMDLTRETRPNYWRTDLELSTGLPGGDSSIHLGLWDAFESNKITAQIGKNFAPESEYRYGIYASKPGIGVDYRLAPRLFLRGDLFDINNPRLDLRTRYEFGGGFVGWAGVSRLFSGNSPAIGVGIRR